MLLEILHPVLRLVKDIFWESFLKPICFCLSKFSLASVHLHFQLKKRVRAFVLLWFFNFELKVVFYAVYGINRSRRWLGSKHFLFQTDKPKTKQNKQTKAGGLTSPAKRERLILIEHSLTVINLFKPKTAGKVFHWDTSTKLTWKGCIPIETKIQVIMRTPCFYLLKLLC